MRACFGLWIKKRVIFMRNALVSVHALKNELYSCVRACFGSWIKERIIFMWSAILTSYIHA